ncbi:unnamed protein product [Rotaria sp. Silwood2]|nr:unnamed protein product [Rotaria sp. Silwood2]
MVSLSNAYSNTDYFGTKRQILAIVATDFPRSTLKAYFPGVTDDLIKEARNHAYNSGKGAPVQNKTKTIERYDESKLLHFLEFVLSPAITVDVPFGIKHLKLTTGEKFDVPNTIRNTTHSRIIRQYYSFCDETTDGSFIPLGDTTLFDILKRCSASIRKSLAGLDSYSTNGSNAFDILTTVCEELAAFHTTLNHIKTLIDNNTHLSDNQRIRYQTIYKRQYELIQEWKKHQLRTVHQEAAKEYVLEQLDATSVYLQIDWAMKWLQLKYRESQSEWFGKKGLPWHLTHIIRVKEPSTTTPSAKSFEHRTMCHVFNYCGQTGKTVVSILVDVLKRLREENPKLEKVYLRCDNAGCYHGSELLLSIKKIYNETGVLICRIDFSESQSDDVDGDEEENVNNSTSLEESEMEVDQLSLQPRLLPSGFYLFDCPHPKCIKQFRRYFNLEKHLTIGKHVFMQTTVPLLDRAKLLYKELIDNDSNRISISLNQFNNLISTTTSSIGTIRSQGWALPQKKPPTHYSSDVVNFLESAFNEGVVTDNKWDPAALSQEMVFAQLNGQPRFNENDFLSPEQIKTYFSKLKAKRSKEGSQSQSQSLTPLPSSSNNSVVDKNTMDNKDEMMIDDEDLDEKEILDEQIDDFDSAMETTQLSYLRSMAENIL